MKAVLIVDDSEDLLMLTKYFIESQNNCSAVTALNLTEVKERFKDNVDFGLAIIDINLGPNEPTGIDVYRWLRENGYAGVIYFLTGHARSYPLVVEAEQLGDVKIFGKPIRAELLEEIVAEALR